VSIFKRRKLPTYTITVLLVDETKEVIKDVAKENIRPLVEEMLEIGIFIHSETNTTIYPYHAIDSIIIEPPYVFTRDEN
jgi:hypothetical protein